ncbi:methyl-accepting chemotaxis protein [Marivivens aquimaris]|uniref:methyl-accepting chemotaxis protein n=1 Tax=Marivivens aquimaris TaxID=2774876 RepID=UPI00187E5CCE|nr:methyl-accepting chemotaxis protein [Marivivens aquimaris]
MTKVEDITRVLDQVSGVGSRMASGIVDVAGALDEIGKAAKEQQDEMTALETRVREILEINDSVQEAIQTVAGNATSNLAALNESIESARISNEGSREIANWVKALDTRIGEVVDTLRSVERQNAEITSIARQVNILAINAKIEAVRAGRFGKGFAVVADAINELSASTTSAADAVTGSVEKMGESFAALRKEATGVQEKASHVIEEVEKTDQKMSAMSEKMQGTVNTTHAMSGEAERISQSIGSFGPAFHSISQAAAETAAGVEESRDRINALVDDSEEIVRLSILGGGASQDQRFINYVRDLAQTISKKFEEAIDRGNIRLDDLFDRNYTPIPNTNPEQMMTRFTRFTDSVLPQYLEAAAYFDQRVVFCAAVDDNGYLPTHNAKFSLPQGPDPVWNTAHCRNRRIFNDRVGLKAGRSREPFLLQVYRRDMGGGEFRMMKDLSAPIIVKGKHWGGLRFAYTI